MKMLYLQLSIFAILLVTCGCGSNAVNQGPTSPHCVPSSSPAHAFVLTSDNSISSFSVDSCTGALTPTNPPSVSTNGNQFTAESLAVDPSGRFAYAANLMSNAEDLATIAMFTINSSTGVLTPTTPPTVPTGFLPQGITIDPTGRFVYTANSDDNTVSMFTVDQTTGLLTPMNPPTVATGWSPLSVNIDPSGRFAYVANQDDGTISMYTVDSSTGVLTPSSAAAVRAGGSPFGVTIDPSSKFAYVPDNIFDLVWEYSIDSTTGVLTPTAEVQVKVGNAMVNDATTVAIGTSGKYAYVVDRNGDTVFVYSIDPGSGALTQIGTATAGAQPWRATVEPSGKFLYVGNESGSISIFSIKDDGTLTAAGITTTQAGAFDISIIPQK